MAHTLDGQGDRQEATRCYQQAVEIFRETGDRWAITHPLCDLAWRIWHEGRLHEALGLMQEYLAVFRQLRSGGGAAMALRYIATMAMTVGDFETAARAAQEEQASMLSRGLPNDAARGLYPVAWVAFAQGHLTQARQQLESALRMARAEDDPRFTASILYLLGRVAVYEGLPDEAASRFEASRLAGRNSNQTPQWNAEVVFGLGQAAALRNDFAGAAALYRESLAGIQAARPEIPARLEALAQAALGLGQGERAARLLAAANRQRAAMGAPILPVDRSRHDTTAAAVRAALGEEDFRRAWAAGEALSVAESVAYALG